MPAVFTIARGSKTAAEVVAVTLEQDGAVGRGECVPYARYGETVEGVIAELEAARAAILGNRDRAAVPALVKASAARNALDCALWDLEAKRRGRAVWQLAGLAATAAARHRLYAEPRRSRRHGRGGGRGGRPPPAQAQAWRARATASGWRRCAAARRRHG